MWLQPDKNIGITIVILGKSTNAIMHYFNSFIFMYEAETRPPKKIFENRLELEKKIFGPNRKCDTGGERIKSKYTEMETLHKNTNVTDSIGKPKPQRTKHRARRSQNGLITCSLLFLYICLYSI